MKWLLPVLLVIPTHLLADGFLYVNGTAVDLGDVYSDSINDSGEVVEYVPSSPSFYLLQNGTRIPIGIPGGQGGYGLINQLGEVAGVTFLNNVGHPWFYNGATTTDLTGFVPQGQQFANININNLGQVLLGTNAPNPPPPYASQSPLNMFLITNGVAQTLAPISIPGVAGIYVGGIDGPSGFNNSGIAIGLGGTTPPYGDPPYVSFLYNVNTGSITTFQSLNPALNFNYATPTAINDAGQVLITGINVQAGQFSQTYLYNNSTFTPVSPFLQAWLTDQGLVSIDLSPDALRQALGEDASHVITSLTVLDVNASGEVIGAFSQEVVPEPGSAILMLIGIASCLFSHRRRALLLSRFSAFNQKQISI